jgi:putative nucleotidyltransferase with HDIG domain
MAEILLLGTERTRLKDEREPLTRTGHRVTVFPAVSGWRSRERQVTPELVIAAVGSCGDVLAELGQPARGFPPPLLFVQHDSDSYQDIDRDHRLVDRLVGPFVHEELLARVDGLVRVRRVVLHGSARAGIASPDRQVASYVEVASRVAQWSDRRDMFEPGHAERVTSLCAMIAETIRLDDEELATLLRAAILHDIGKAGVPVEVLHQREPLDENQQRLIRAHPKRGAALISALDRNPAVADAILYHHERPDGRGYYGVEWSAVPMSARVLAVAEVYDAMTSTRLADPLLPDEALERLESSKGTRLDNDCVEVLVRRIRPRPRTLKLSKDPGSLS